MEDSNKNIDLLKRFYWSKTSKIKILQQKMSNTQKILTEEDQVSIIEPQQEPKSQLQGHHTSNPIQNQFLQAKEKQINSKAENLIGLITHQIENEIQESRISISDQKKPYQLNDKNTSMLIKNDSQKFDQKKIAEFVKKRKNLEEQIRRLKLEQEQQKHKSRSKSPKQDIHYKTFRSNFTSKEHMEISRIMKKSEQFQHRLQSKDKQIDQILSVERKKQKEEQKIYRENLKQKNKQQALKKIKQIQDQQQQRAQRLKSQNKKFQQLKKIKLFHQKIQEHDKLFEQQKKHKEEQLLRQKRQSMTFNFEEIKNHEKKCYETARITKQKLENQVMQKLQKMKQEQKLLSQTYRPSKFLLTLWNEEKQKEELQRERIEKMKSLYNKKSSFQQKLRDVHKEQIKTKPKQEMRKSIIDQKLEDHRLKVKSMSAADIYKQGQEYMKSVHSSISPVLIEHSKVELQNSFKSLKNGSKIQYRDYLQEHKLKKQILYKSTGKLTTRENPQIHELQNLIGKKNQNSNHQLQKAKLIAQKLDRKARNSSTTALIDSISAKLKIIEEFS